MFVGNGTLNKQAGIDYKQLSLTEKRNENQSGEVFYLALFTYISTDDEIKPHVVYPDFSMFISHV